MTQTPSSDHKRVMAALWAHMALMYGDLWTKTKGDAALDRNGDLTVDARFWAAEFRKNRMSLDHVMQVIQGRELAEQFATFPPKVGEFIKLAKPNRPAYHLPAADLPSLPAPKFDVAGDSVAGQALQKLAEYGARDDVPMAGLDALGLDESRVSKLSEAARNQVNTIRKLLARPKTDGPLLTEEERAALIKRLRHG